MEWKLKGLGERYSGLCRYVWGVASGMGTSRGLICDLLGLAQRRSGRGAAGFKRKRERGQGKRKSEREELKLHSGLVRRIAT
jgi:hypothetical protein